jgi:hypothetical protein
MVAPIFESSYSEMVITPVFETGIQGSIPCKNILAKALNLG